MEARRREFDEVQGRASGLIETRLDDAVSRSGELSERLPRVEGLDRDVELITRAYFDGAGVTYAANSSRRRGIACSLAGTARGISGRLCRNRRRLA